MMTEAVEMCPFCGLESIFPNYDVKKSGFVAFVGIAEKR